MVYLKRSCILLILAFTCVYGASVKNNDIKITTESPGECKTEDFGGYGFLATPNYPDCYPNNALCQWSLNAPAGQIVRLEFTGYFGLESCCDFVEVYDGPDSSYPLIGRYSGHKPGTITTSGRSVFILFVTDGSVVNVGFEIFYAFVPAGLDSSNEVVPHNSTLLEEYRKRQNVELTPKGKEDDNSRGELCNAYTLEPSSPPTPSPSPQQCKEEHYSGYGILASPNYPGCYPNNADCGISLGAPAGQIVRLEFTRYFGLESCCDRVDVHDGPTDGFPLLGSFTGQNKPGTVVSTGRSMFIRFRTDSSVVDVGFETLFAYVPVGADNNTTGAIEEFLVQKEKRDEGVVTEEEVCSGHSPSTAWPITTTTHWPWPSTSVPTDCPQEHYGSYGFLTTPNYPDCYPNNAHCGWSLEAPAGEIVRVEFTGPYYGLESGYDYVEIYDGPTASYSLLGRFSGWIRPDDISSTSRYMFIRFTSDSIITDIGFELFYQLQAPGASTPLLDADNEAIILIDKHSQEREKTRGAREVCQSSSSLTPEPATTTDWRQCHETKLCPPGRYCDRGYCRCEDEVFSEGDYYGRCLRRNGASCLLNTADPLYDPCTLHSECVARNSTHGRCECETGYVGTDVGYCWGDLWASCEPWRRDQGNADRLSSKDGPDHMCASHLLLSCRNERCACASPTLIYETGTGRGCVAPAGEPCGFRVDFETHHVVECAQGMSCVEWAAGSYRCETN